MKFLAPILALFLALVTAQANAAVVPGVGLAVPISADQKGEKFDGILTIKDFRTSTDGQGLVAVGVLSGIASKGGNTRTIVADMTVPVRKVYSDSGTTAAMVAQQVTCPILHLDLGPIDLTLLGLNINISEIIIDITATQGGGLLGDLLCTIANLLNSGPLNQILNQLIALLNQLLGILG